MSGLIGLRISCRCGSARWVGSSRWWS